MYNSHIWTKPSSAGGRCGVGLPFYCSSLITFLTHIWWKVWRGSVRFAEKTSWNSVPADLLWEKNTVLAEKITWKVRIIREANMASLKVIMPPGLFWICWFSFKFSSHVSSCEICGYIYGLVICLEGLSVLVWACDKFEKRITMYSEMISTLFQ